MSTLIFQTRYCGEYHFSLFSFAKNDCCEWLRPLLFSPRYSLFGTGIHILRIDFLLRKQLHSVTLIIQLSE